jgi:hypothetical protein
VKISCGQLCRHIDLAVHIRIEEAGDLHDPACAQAQQVDRPKQKWSAPDARA